MENKKYFNVSKLDKEAFNSYVIELNEAYYSIILTFYLVLNFLKIWEDMNA